MAAVWPALTAGIALGDFLQDFASSHGGAQEEVSVGKRPNFRSRAIRLRAG